VALTAVGPINQSIGLQGGSSAALNITAAAVIKPSSGIICRLSVIAPGSSGNLTLNDCALVANAAASNEIASFPSAALAAGMVLLLDWPCGTGITVGAVTAGGQYSMSFT
jgi:hypothetical protein